MKVDARWSIRTRLTAWYVCVLAFLLLIFAIIVFIFQYVTLTRQIVHDEMQDAVTVEGLLYFDGAGQLQLRQDYYSRPQSHLLVDRLMEVLDLNGTVLYRSKGLDGESLGGPLIAGEGDGSANERIVPLRDGSRVSAISHIHGMHGRDVVIRVGYSLRPLRERMWQFVWLLGIALLATILLAGITGQWIAGKAMRPIGLMAERAEGITANNLHDRLVVANPRDELGALATVFNHLLERLEQSFQQLQRFTADAAHELRTPLASLRTVGEVSLAQQRTPEQYRDAISSILEETQRLNHTIDSLLLLARAEAGNSSATVEAIALAPLLLEVASILSVLAEEKRIQVLVRGSEDSAKVRGDRSLLRVAIINLLHNALKFSPPEGTVRMELASDEAFAYVNVMDQGPGIAKNEFDAVFERFYRGRGVSSESGNGLGLSIVKLIVNRVGGTIEFDRAAEEGTCVKLRLPLASDSEQAAP
jgi:heavy metal sensor kinase